MGRLLITPEQSKGAMASCRESSRAGRRGEEGKPMEIATGTPRGEMTSGRERAPAAGLGTAARRLLLTDEASSTALATRQRFCRPIDPCPNQHTPDYFLRWDRITIRSRNLPTT